MMITYLFDYYIFFIYFNLWKSDSSSCHCQTNVQMLWGFLHVYLNVNTVDQSGLKPFPSE